jgi:hypothetical protein
MCAPQNYPRLAPVPGKVSSVRSPCCWNVTDYKQYLERVWDVAKEVSLEIGKFVGDGLAERSFEAVPMAVSGPVLHVGGVAVLDVGMVAFAPLSAALSPCLKAYEISEMADGIFSLYDLLEQAKKHGGGKNDFHCNCGECAKNIKYMIDKGEWRVFHIALSVATVGVWWGAKKLQSGIKSSTQATSKKGEVSKALVAAAKSGCSVATVAIFLRMADKMGYETIDEKSDKKLAIKLKEKRQATKRKIFATVAAILYSEDGWQEFKELW